MSHWERCEQACRLAADACVQALHAPGADAPTVDMRVVLECAQTCRDAAEHLSARSSLSPAMAILCALVCQRTAKLCQRRGEGAWCALVSEACESARAACSALSDTSLPPVAAL